MIIGCRNRERGEQALGEIREASGSQEVALVMLDMASVNSIKEAVLFIRKKVRKLDVLIHNAADFDISRKTPVLSPDGIETVWATNHIGPVQLTHELLDLLKSSVQGRIITVASKGLVMHPMLKVNLEDPEFRRRRFSVSRAYYQSKLAQVMYTYWLARELADTQVTANCIRVTNVKIDLERYPDLTPIARWAYAQKSRSAISPEDMARTYTWLATSPLVAGMSGKYFNEKNREVLSSRYSRQTEHIDQLVKLTKNYIK